MNEKIETIVIGGGQAGLVMSYYLSHLNREHLVLERAAQPANTWRNERWDSFTFVSPNWTIQIPGAEYRGPDPNGFMPRDEIVAYFENYVRQFRLPVRFNTRVDAVEMDESSGSYRVVTPAGDLRAQNVIIATGYFQKPKVPRLSADLPSDLLQLKVTEYRNAAALAPGAVLVVGSGQSGCQVAEDLNLSGRKVYLCVGGAGRVPRRYRGKDIWEWFVPIGFLERTPEVLPSLQARFNASPHLSGTRGGHTINLHQFARDGIVLLGHLRSIEERRLLFAPDLKESLARNDKFEADFVKKIDEYVEKTGGDAPREELPMLRDGYDVPVVDTLDLREAGVNTIIWAGGFGFDYKWVHPAKLDEFGYPLTKENAAAPGLYFVGLPWLPKFHSSLFTGLAEPAARIADRIKG